VGGYYRKTKASGLCLKAATHAKHPVQKGEDGLETQTERSVPLPIRGKAFQGMRVPGLPSLRDPLLGEAGQRLGKN